MKKLIISTFAFMLFLTPVTLTAMSNEPSINQYYIPGQTYPNVVAQIGHLELTQEFVSSATEQDLISLYRVTSFDNEDGNQAVNIEDISYDSTANYGTIKFSRTDSDNNYGYVITSFSIV